MYKYLNFYNKQGEYFNFSYDETLDKWSGRVDMDVVSEDLIEDFQLYILEEVFDTNANQKTYAYPISEIGATGPTASAVFTPEVPVDEIFLYNFTLGATVNVLEKYDQLDYSLDVESFTLGASGSAYPNIKQVSSFREEALQINIGFCPSGENAYQDTLFLKDSNGHTFAEIFIYGEGEEEDERLRDLLQNMGADLLPEDTIIFDTADVNEEKIDWKLLNQKRKELLLEYSNIYPYIGSYKALINIIKYFGYQNVRMKEYWLNVDQDSVNFGKYRQIQIDNIFSENADFNTSQLIPSKIYKKTSKFGLFYDITTETGEFDEDGIPIVEEVFDFSPEEILIKIFALRRKLKNYFLPLNARIIDIVGESVFYAKYDINVWNDQNRIDDIELGLKPKMSITPEVKDCHFISDLRYLNYFGCPIGPDLNLGGSTDLLSWRIGLNSAISVDGVANRVQYYTLNVQVPTGSTEFSVTARFREDLDTGQVDYEPYEIADRLIEEWRSNSDLADNFNIYQEGGSSGILRIIQTEPLGDGSVSTYWTSDTNPAGAYNLGGWRILGPTDNIATSSPGGTASSINVSSGPSGSFGPSGAPMSYYDDCFIGYFDRKNVDVLTLNDDEDIVVGAAVVLNNDTFNVTWDDANVTFNQIDYYGSTGNTLFSDFTNSLTIAGWTSISTPIGATVTGFPYSSFPLSNLYTWNNIGNYGYYEMRWIISKEADETPAFYKDSGVLPIEEINNYPVVLPYVGKYKVELYLWDGYNTVSTLFNEDYIEVCLPESDMIGWYSKRELDYQWITDKYPVQSDYIKPPIPLGQSEPKLTWDDYATTWDLPLHPNEEFGMGDISFNTLDSIEFYQNQINPVTDPLIDKYPYQWKNLDRFANWNDSYHLWWDNTGTKITQWEITGVTGPTATFFMTRGNTEVDLINKGFYYEQGPTGFEGATANPSIIGATVGDIVVSEANRRTYQYDGTDWNYIIDIVDTFVATGLTGSTLIENMRELTRQFNQELPNDGLSHPFFNDFIYYYNEEYNSSYGLDPYIRAVSKDFDRGQRHIIGMTGATGDNRSYETIYFGYVGDIPTHFEIYEVSATGPTGTILISGMTAPYAIGSTNLFDLQDELNGPTAQALLGIGDYEYNIVLGASGWTGPTGPTAYTSVKLQGVAKSFVSPEEISILYTGGINGTAYGRSLIKNITWDQLRILKYSQELPLLSLVNFTYDNSKMWGKKNPKWVLSKENDPNFPDIYYNNRYFSYLFTKRGSYTLSVELEDTNGNKQKVTKTEIIKII
jgi:hypothetical protein